MTRTRPHPGNCPPCDRHWYGLREAHCTVCHRHFGSVTAFDRHQPTPGGCPDPAGFRDRDGNPVLRLTDSTSGPTWVTWKSDEQREAARQHFAQTRRERSPAQG